MTSTQDPSPVNPRNPPTRDENPAVDADLVIIADWSAAQGRKPEPCEDRCWIAWGWSDERPGGRSPPVYCPTRLEAEDRIAELIASSGPERVLLGIDVAIGLPLSEVGEPVLPTGRDLLAMLAERITDSASGTNNRFEVAAQLNRDIRSVTGREHGPFWGRPRDLKLTDLEEKRPSDTGVRKLRSAETAARRTTKTKPKSPWQLTGAGSVGSQALMAAPMLARLLGRDDTSLWPFERSGRVTIAEVYPSMFEPRAPSHWYRDARQVCDTRDALLDDVITGSTRRSGDASISLGMNTDADLEGWILGVPR
ncbi:MAG: hypothetical protein AAF235_01835 [Planctomycetota bacterium]